MEARMKNPALILEVNPAIQSMMTPIYQSGLDLELLEYVSLRVGQLNNCELCISQSFIRADAKPNMKNKIEHVLDWKISEVFTEAERVVLEITEAITTLKDRYNSVPDSLWLKLEKHFSERERAALVLLISVMNMFTRINVATRQLTPDWQ